MCEYIGKEGSNGFLSPKRKNYSEVSVFKMNLFCGFSLYR